MIAASGQLSGLPFDGLVRHASRVTPSRLRLLYGCKFHGSILFLFVCFLIHYFSKSFLESC